MIKLEWIFCFGWIEVGEWGCDCFVKVICV